MQSKRTIFPNKLLPYALLAPQLIITIIFFLWPAAQAVRSSFEREDPFGFRTTFIWFQNYTRLFADPGYLRAASNTAVFAVGVTILSMGVALLLAVAVNRLLRSGKFYTTLLVWPYAVAPIVAGILWWFMFN
nr:glycerol-3-phosphate transporter permease [Pseudomonas sp.]